MSDFMRSLRIAQARYELCRALGLEPDRYTFAPIAVEALTGEDVPVKNVRAEMDEDGMATITFTSA